MSKFDQCITYAGGQAAVFGLPDSRFRDPNIFKVPNNLLIQPEKPSEGNKFEYKTGPGGICAKNKIL